MNKINVFFFLLVVIICSSCGTYKNIPYFQDVNKATITQNVANNFSPTTIHSADILGINVTSRTPESSAIFNYNAKDMQSNVAGYLVDSKGEVQLPLIGTIKVVGLTPSALQEKIGQSLATFYKDAVVNVRILNFKVAVYGDVLRPDIYTIKDEQITLTQALALAGDLNITANRNNVILIRVEDGKRNFIPIDMTSKKLFESPYYYLENNDEIYVQPGKLKLATVDRGRTVSLILSGLSVVAIVFSVLYK